MKTSSDGEWHHISLLARNRVSPVLLLLPNEYVQVAAVCDYYTFVRYLHQRLIKSGPRDSYFDLAHLRRNMCLAKLGLGFVPKTNARPGY